MTSNPLTINQLTKVLPPAVKKRATQELVDTINNITMDSHAKEAFKENILSYSSVMKTGKYKLSAYLEAVKYVTHKLMGDSNTVAFAKTFPDRMENFRIKGYPEKDIASAITSYNKNKLVNLVFEQTLVPSYVLNADLHQKALNIQAELMMNDDISPKVRSDAANSLLVHLKMPETTKIELDVSVKEDKVIDELRQSTLALAAQQRKMLEAGAMKPKDVAESAILIEGECEENVN